MNKDRIETELDEQQTAYPDGIAVLREVSWGRKGIKFVGMSLSQIPEDERKRVFETIELVQGYINKGHSQFGLFMGFGEGEKFTSILVISANSRTAESKFIPRRRFDLFSEKR